MKSEPRVARCLAALFVALAALLASPAGSMGQPAEPPAFKPEQLEQLLAPVALYPDALLAQLLMAATYPLEVVQADRWAKQNQSLKGDPLAAALEKQPWDPSVKSLVNFPQVLAMMSEKLDWTQNVGDAFLAQGKEVMEAVQSLRRKAAAAGNLQSTPEQKVVYEQETIVIQSASPQVVYVPAYEPTVVYGSWAHPAYPPATYYPPGYVPGAGLFAFGAGMAMGAAWGYAWGDCDWNGGDVDIDVDRNASFNRSIDRGKYASQYQGKVGSWQHNPEHRKGVSYRDPATARQYNRASTSDAVRSREAFRGRSDAGRQELSRGAADAGRGRSEAASRDLSGGRADGTQRSSADGRPATRDAGRQELSGQRGDAFSGAGRSGEETRDFSSRGSASRQSMSAGGSASRSVGGGGRGGGRR
jgi:hypothetical protein